MLAKYFISSALFKSQLAPYCLSVQVLNEHMQSRKHCTSKQTSKRQTIATWKACSGAKRYFCCL